MMQVGFGLAKDPDDIYWLLQGKGSVSNAINLPIALCPLSTVPGLRNCVHSINLQSEVTPQVLAVCENLVLPEMFSFCPTEESRVYYIKIPAANDIHILQEYHDLYSPSWMPNFPIWMETKNLYHQVATVFRSNLVPPVVYGNFFGEEDKLRMLIDTAKAQRGRLILAGQELSDLFYRAGVVEVEMPAPIPLNKSELRRQAGVYYLKRFMRGEGDGRS